jgi:1,4-alpha-glucan branching enzyme
MRLRRPSIAAILTVIVCTSCTPGLQTPALAPMMTPTGMRFSLVDADAKTVSLVGAFNQWSATSHQLTRDGTTNIWTLVVPLPPGEHLFMFVIDGSRWVTPPLADDFVDDGFGSKNGVVIVRPQER